MKKLNKSELRTRHLLQLSAILDRDMASTKVIFHKLKCIEHAGHKLAEDYCNGVIDSDIWDHKVREFKSQLRDLLSFELWNNVHLNGDPRGYFLKLSDEYVRAKQLNIERDWGGYGIFCPEGI